MGIRGLEHTPVAGSEPRFSAGASQNAAHFGTDGPLMDDPRLARIVAAWDGLSEQMRARMLALLDGACG